MKNNLLQIIILGCIVVIFLQRCNDDKQNITKIEKYRDTLFITKQKDTTIYNVQPTKIIPYLVSSKDTQYLPHSNYDVLKVQYEQLRDSLLATKTYEAKYNIDSVGEANITTKLFKNKMIEQTFKYNIKYPIIKDCTVVHTPQKRQFYFGAGVIGNSYDFVKGAEINLSLKTKTDKIYEIRSQYLNNELLFGIGTKWKL
jgi:hypothetical protein